MRILHTADWHLGNYFYGHDRMVEYRHFFNWLLSTLRQQLPDVLIISGNVFDSASPSASAEQLLYDFLLEAVEAVRGLQIVMISGNRDSAGRLEASAPLLKRHNIYVRGSVKYTDDGKIDFDNLILPLSSRLYSNAELVCLAIPYLRVNDYPAGMTLDEGLQYYFDNIMRNLKKSEFRKLPVVAAAHFYVSGTQVSDMERREWAVVGGQGCIRPATISSDLSYVALGHLHRGQRVDYGSTEIYYAGCALPMSFAEEELQHGAELVDIDGNGHLHQIQRMVYEPLRRLMTIPQEGGATVKEVFDAIGELPRRKKNECGDDWPYLEIRLQAQQTDPNLLHEVNVALMDRSVHFCHVVREWKEKPLVGISSSHLKKRQALDPLEMAKHIFDVRYHEEMPEELVTRFKEAEQRC